MKKNKKETPMEKRVRELEEEIKRIKRRDINRKLWEYPWKRQPYPKNPFYWERNDDDWFHDPPMCIAF